MYTPGAVSTEQKCCSLGGLWRAQFIKWVPFFLSGDYFWKVVVVVHRPAFLILTLFQSNIYKSPSKGATKSTFFFTICWSLNLLMSFTPFKTWLQISLCVWLLCVCVHPLNKDSQAIIGTFYQCHFQEMVGWVAFKVSLLLMLKFKSLKMWTPMKVSKGGGFYDYRLKVWLFYGYRVIFFSYG